MQWLLIAVTHIAIALFGASCANAENGKGQISSVFEAFGYSPACVASALTSCEYSSKKELSVDVVDSIEVTKSLLQEIKSERENSASVVKTLLQEIKSEIGNSGSAVKSICQEKSASEKSASVVKTLLQEMKSKIGNSVSEFNAIRQEMKSQGENSSSVVQILLQDMKWKVQAVRQEMMSERENSTSIVKSLLQEMKSEVQGVRQEMKSEVQAVRQEMKSERENSTSVVRILLQEMKSEVQTVHQQMRSEVQAVHQEMKSERENSVSIVKTLLQEMKSERQNEKNSIAIHLGNLENITHRISTLEVILQEATSERKNVSYSLADMKTFLQEVKAEQENDPATTANYSSVNIIDPQNNCADLRVLMGDGSSGGVQTVYPYLPNPKSVIVFCDQVTDGGGWTVIQSRSPLPKRENFTRSWNEYVEGFGDLKGEFWLGLDNIHALTNSAQMELRVDLEDAEGEKRFAKYRTFHVGDVASKYVLRIEGYSGDAGDAMIYPTNKNITSNTMKFSTFDNDNDLSLGNCANEFYGGWWFNSCFIAHLNGLPIVGKVSRKGEGIHWNTFRNGSYSLKKANMKIRPVSLGF